MERFDSMSLSPALLRALHEAGYQSPTPIQAQAIPALLDGRDMIGCAQTGTGKTAAFALPVLQHLSHAPQARRRTIRALVLSPTRELASQIEESFVTYGKYVDVRSMVIFGGVNQKRQTDVLERGIDVLIATPGRLLDLQSQGFIDLSGVTHFVLDEADRMLDMGFLPDIRRVMRTLPPKRQNLLFSATMPRPIEELANSFLHDPLRVAVTPPATTVERIEQRVLFVDKAEKPRLLKHLLDDLAIEQTIVFTRTKHGANRLVDWLDKQGVRSAALHGNKSQSAREKALDGFRSGSIRLLVATDIAARGIDVEGVSHVFNYDLPNEPETYVHRIGRTGRAGRAGAAIAFCGNDEVPYLHDIEKTTGQRVPHDAEHPWHDESASRRYASARSQARGPSPGPAARPSPRGPSGQARLRPNEPTPRDAGQNLSQGQGQGQGQGQSQSQSQGQSQGQGQGQGARRRRRRPRRPSETAQAR